MSPRIFVGNISYETSQQDLETLFSEVGQVREVFLAADRDTQRPRGFAFVEFDDGLDRRPAGSAPTRGAR